MRTHPEVNYGYIGGGSEVEGSRALTAAEAGYGVQRHQPIIYAGRYHEVFRQRMLERKMHERIIKMYDIDLPLSRQAYDAMARSEKDATRLPCPRRLGSSYGSDSRTIECGKYLCLCPYSCENGLCIFPRNLINIVLMFHPGLIILNVVNSIWYLGEQIDNLCAGPQDVTLSPRKDLLTSSEFMNEHFLKPETKLIVTESGIALASTPLRTHDGGMDSRHQWNWGDDYLADHGNYRRENSYFVGVNGGIMWEDIRPRTAGGHPSIFVRHLPDLRRHWCISPCLDTEKYESLRNGSPADRMTLFCDTGLFTSCCSCILAPNYVPGYYELLIESDTTFRIRRSKNSQVRNILRVPPLKDISAEALVKELYDFRNDFGPQVP